MALLTSFSVDGIKIDIFPLTYNAAVRWQNNTQPEIRMEHGRSDVDWNWVDIYHYTLGASLVSQKASAYVAMIEGVQIGMMAAALNYSCSKDNGQDIRTYLWYLSKSPVLFEIIQTFNDVNGQVLEIPFMDIMLKVLLNEAKRVWTEDSTFWLHASPEGDNPSKLWQIYLNKGLRPCRLQRPLTFREDDGRYMYFPRSQANRIMTQRVTY